MEPTLRHRATDVRYNSTLQFLRVRFDDFVGSTTLVGSTRREALSDVHDVQLNFHQEVQLSTTFVGSTIEPYSAIHIIKQVHGLVAALAIDGIQVANTHYTFAGIFSLIICMLITSQMTSRNNTEHSMSSSLVAAKPSTGEPLSCCDVLDVDATTHTSLYDTLPIMGRLFRSGVGDASDVTLHLVEGLHP